MDWQRHAGDLSSRLTHRYPSMECTQSFIDSLDRRDRETYAIRPQRESPGFDAGRDFAEEFFADSDASRRGRTRVYSVEVWGSDGRVIPAITVPAGESAVLRDALAAAYPGAEMSLATFADPEPGEFVAAARLGLARDCIYSLRHRRTNDPLESDPNASLLPKLFGAPDERTLVQDAFTPVSKRWYKRGIMPPPIGLSGDSLADSLSRGTVEDGFVPRTIKPHHRTAAAKDIDRQSGRDAFACSMRVMAIADSRERASARVRAIVDSLNRTKNPATGQHLVAHPVAGVELRGLVRAAYGRWPDSRRWIREALHGRRHVLTDEELGDWLLHLSAARDVDAPIDWGDHQQSERIPPDAF